MTVTLSTAEGICTFMVTNDSGLTVYYQYSGTDGVEIGSISTGFGFGFCQNVNNSTTRNSSFFNLFRVNTGSSAVRMVPALMVTPEGTGQQYFSIYNFEDGTRTRYYLYNDNSTSVELSDEYMSESITTSTNPFPDNTPEYSLDVVIDGPVTGTYTFTSGESRAGDISDLSTLYVSTDDSTLELSILPEALVSINVQAASAGNSDNIVGINQDDSDSFTALPNVVNIPVTTGAILSNLYISGADYKTITVDYENTTDPEITDTV